MAKSNARRAAKGAPSTGRNIKDAWTDHIAHPKRDRLPDRQVPQKNPGESIGVPYDTQLQAAELVQSGLPFGAIARFQGASGLTLDRIKQVARLSEGSFARRKQHGRLSQDESERLLRISRVFELATSLHEGDQNDARQWLETPIPALGNRRPLELAGTEPGAREVEDLIGRIEHGVVT